MAEEKVQPQQKITFALSLLDVRCEKFSLTSYGEKNTKSIASDNYSFHYTFEIGIRENEQILDFYLSTDFYEGKVENRKDMLASMRVKTSLRVVNFMEVTKKAGNDQILIPDKLIEIGNALSLNHSRGIFAIKIENTLYSNALIPLANSSIWGVKKQ